MDFSTLNLLFRCSKEFSHQKIKKRDLNETECMICSCIFSKKQCSQDDLVQMLRLDKTTAAKSLQKLEKKGLILRRQAEEDKRKKLIYMTEYGQKQLADIMNLHDKWLSAILPVLTKDEQLRFENYCERLLIAAEKLIQSNEQKDASDL